MNQPAQLAVVFTEAERGVEAGNPAAAQSAQARFVERRGIQKRCPAADAKMLGRQRVRRGKAAPTYGNTGNFG